MVKIPFISFTFLKRNYLNGYMKSDKFSPQGVYDKHTLMKRFGHVGLSSGCFSPFSK